MRIRKAVVILVMLLGIVPLTVPMVSAQDSIFGVVPFPSITPRNVPNVSQLAFLGAGSVQTVSWSNGGDMLAVGTSVGVWIYDAPFEANNRYLLTSSTLSITKTVFSPDDRRLAIITRDQQIGLWDVETGRNLFITGVGGLQDVAFNSDGTSLVSVGLGANLVLWDIETGTPDTTFITGVAMTSVTFSADDTQIIFGDVNGDLHIYDIESGEITLTRPAHEGGVSTVGLQPNGDGVISGGSDGVIRLWTADLSELVESIRGASNIESVVFASDNTSLLSVTRANTPQIWDISTGELLQTFAGHDGIVVSAAFSPDESQVISGGTDGTVRVWNVSSGEQEMLFTGFTGSFNEVAFNPTLTHVVAGAANGTVKVWELNNLANTVDLRGHFGAVSAFAFSSDGRTLASASEDRTIRLWSMAELDGSTAGQPRPTPQAESTEEPEEPEEETPESAQGDPDALVINVPSTVSVLSFTQDGRSLIAAGIDGTVTTWNVRTGEQVSLYNSRLENIVTISFTDNPDVYVVVGENGDVETWNAQTGERLSNFASGHARTFVTPNNLIVGFVVGRDVSLVELSTQAWLRNLQGHTAQVKDVTISEDGTLIATCSEDGTVRIWGVPQ